MDLLTEREKQKAKELLDELTGPRTTDLPLSSGLGPEGLADWNFRANTFLIFTACRHPFIIFEAPAVEDAQGASGV